MCRIILGVCLAVAVCCGGVLHAETIVIPLPAPGPYINLNPGQQMPFSFDLGVPLTEVQEARFNCQGSVTAGVTYWGEVFSWHFSAVLPDDLNWPYFWSAQGPAAGEATRPDPEPFAGESAFESYMGTWDFLLDGQADGWVELTWLVWTPKEWVPQEFPSGYLDAASLIIEATPAWGPGDTDGDVKVDIVDLTTLAANWSALPQNQGAMKNWSQGDFNFDWQVDIVDLTALSANWTFGPGSAAPVPEPTTLALLAIGGVGLLRRKRGYGA